MQFTIWEIYDTRIGKTICQCSSEYDAIQLCQLTQFRAYRPQQLLYSQVIDVPNLYRSQLMPSQSRIEAQPQLLQLKSNDQQPLNL